MGRKYNRQELIGRRDWMNDEKQIDFEKTNGLFGLDTSYVKIM